VKAKPLTKKEQAWLDKLEKVMQERPTKRLHCYTIGDKTLEFYDINISEKWEKENPRERVDAGYLHQEAGSHLGCVVGSFNIDSCAG